MKLGFFMRTDEFIKRLSEISKENESEFERLRTGIPIGEDDAQNVALARGETDLARCHHTCVTGSSRTEFIRRVVFTLSCIYDKSEIAFLIVSPNMAYGELLKLKNADVTVPFIRDGKDLALVLETVKTLARARVTQRFSQRLFVVLDGLEDLPDDTKQGTFEIYRPFLEAVGTSGVEIITGVELRNSIYAGYPGVFVGVGNALITPDADGNADVTFVALDGSMGLPKKITYPSIPTVRECIEYFNGIA